MFVGVFFVNNFQFSIFNFQLMCIFAFTNRRFCIEQKPNTYYYDTI
jgi:hypothetical protein